MGDEEDDEGDDLGVVATEREILDEARAKAYRWRRLLMGFIGC